MAQHTLLPSLTALLPSSTYNRFLAHISLQSIHVEPYLITEHVYTATAQVLPGQLKSLRIRQKRRNTGKTPSPGAGAGSGHEGDEHEEDEERGDGYEYSVVHLSNPLSGREYADMSVRACTALDVVGCETRGEVEMFVKALGFQYSHSYTRSGLLFHLSLPYPASHMTLHLSITRVSLHCHPISGSTDKTGPDSANPNHSAEPYLVQLEPCRPVPAVVSGITPAGGAGANAKRDPGLEEMVRFVEAASERIQGVVWETGR